MSRYIDADALTKAVYRSGIDNQADISTLIEDQPTADVEEVVRCKDCTDCEHCYPRKDKGGEAIEGYYCYYHKRWVTASYYCGDGERREG